MYTLHGQHDENELKFAHINCYRSVMNRYRQKFMKTAQKTDALVIVNPSLGNSGDIDFYGKFL